MLCVRVSYARVHIWKHVTSMTRVTMDSSGRVRTPSSLRPLSTHCSATFPPEPCGSVCAQTLALPPSPSSALGPQANIVKPSLPGPLSSTRSSRQSHGHSQTLREKPGQLLA